jgi:hypothetical protein
MPEGDIGLEGEGGNGGGSPPPQGGPAETLTLPGTDLGEAPAESCGEIVRFVQEQWRLERQRADQAEQAAAGLREQLAKSEAALEAAREALDAAERRHAIDLRLLEAGTVDLESARLLTELAVSRMDDADVSAAVTELRRRKPFLFGRSRAGSHGGAAMAAATAGSDPIEQIAEEAIRTGDRAALMRYLRARRGG